MNDFNLDELFDEFDKDEEIKDFKFKSNDLTEEEYKEFYESEEYKNLKAEVLEDGNSSLNLNGKSVQEIMGLSKLGDLPSYSHNSIEHFDIDLVLYEDIVDQSPMMQETIERGEELLPTFKYLHQDIFLSLYKYKANIIPQHKIHSSSKANRAIMLGLINTPEYIYLRQNCRLDLFNAALGTEIIGGKAIDIIKDALEKVKEREEQLKKLEELIKKEEEIDEIIQENEELDELIQEMKMQGKSASQYEDQLQENIENAAKLKELANKLAEECDELLDDSDSIEQITVSLGAEFTGASKEIQEVSDISYMWGLSNEDGTLRIPFQNKKEAVEIIRKSPKLTNLTDLIGRMKESAKIIQKKKSKHGEVDIRSITTGHKIEDVLPSDKINLTMKNTKPDFYRRMTDNQLFVYSKQSTKEKNKGPIIICVDTSGSMSGNQEIWSKALSIGVLEIAQMQKRDFACILFSSHAQEPIVIGKDEISPEKIISIAEKFDSGGTNFESPLNKAINLINDSKFNNADILFITDGECSVSDNFIRKFNKTKEDKEFKCIGVLVECGRSSRTSKSSLKEFCDDIMTVSSIADLTNANADVNEAIFNVL